MSNRSGRKSVLFFLVAIAGIIAVMIVSRHRHKFIIKMEPPAGEVKKLFTSGQKLVAVSFENEVYVWDWENLSAEPRKGAVSAQDVVWVEPDRLLWAPLPKADEIIVSDLKCEQEYNRISLERPWRCEILRTSRNGKFTAVGLIEQERNENSTNSFQRIRIGMIDSKYEKVSEVVTVGSSADDFELNNVAVSEDGAYAAAVGRNNGGWVVVIDVKGKRILWERKLEWFAKMLEVTFSPDGKTLYAGGRGAIVYGFETIGGRVKQEWVVGSKIRIRERGADKDSITAIDVSDDSGLVVTAATRSIIYMWNAITGEAVADRPHGHKSSTISDMVFSPDASRVATIGTRERDKIHVWQVPVIK
jgi:WD40 repeat protein